MICGGLDIGGTKIEARLFDADLNATHSHRVPTPRDSADAFFAALGGQVAWLRERTGADLPIGIAMTGVVEPGTGLAQTANLPISGQHMPSRLSAVAGRPLPVMNDAMALGALRVLSARGVRVPEDVAVIGFDDVDDARYSTPSLSSIAPGRRDIARTAVDLLVERIAAPTEARPFVEWVASHTG